MDGLVGGCFEGLVAKKKEEDGWHGVLLGEGGIWLDGLIFSLLL